MSGSTVPDLDALIRAKIRQAIRYVDVFDWKIFILGLDKTPLPNCVSCHNADWTHQRDDCTCLTCHGFYAATTNHDLLNDMIRRHPDGWLAVRTGQASRLLVLDFEAAPNADGETGYDTRDSWSSWTGHNLVATLEQRTQSGGLHMLYRLPPGVVVKGRNRILPQTDVKAEGGYVAVPTPGRDARWWDHSDGREPAAAPAELLDWLVKARGRSGGGSSGVDGSVSVNGYDFQRFVTTGCPDGARDQFFNDLIFRYRKAGHSYERAHDLVRAHWERCQQPPDAEWYMPWEHVAYKLDRVWQTVAPPALPAWRPTENVVGTTDEGETIVQRGNVSIVRSDW